MDPSTIQRVGDIRYQEIVAWAEQQAMLPPRPRQWTWRGLFTARRGPSPTEAQPGPGSAPEPATRRNGRVSDERELGRL